MDFTTLKAENSSMHQHDDHQSDNTIMYKVISMIILSGVSIAIGILPILSSKFSKLNDRFIKILMGFGGGVLLATIYIHLYPEVSAEMDRVFEKKELHWPIPPTGLFVCLGFFMIYFVEEVLDFITVRSRKSKDASRKNSTPNNTVNGVVPNGPSSSHQDIETGQARQEKQARQAGHDQQHGDHGHHGHSHIPAIMLENNNTNSLAALVKGLFQILGISTHELFEGLALGLLGYQHDVLQMLLAVAIHKFVIAFCFGVQMCANKLKRRFAIAYIITFAIVSPIGIGIGILIGNSNHDHILNAVCITPAILQAISIGTLIYVVFFEILKDNKHGFKQFLSITFGFLLIVIVQFYSGHHHHHHYHHEAGSHNETNEHGHHH